MVLHMLSNSDLIELTAFRKALHRRPEISGEEVETAAAVVSALDPLRPTEILTGLGGHGVAATFDSGQPGPTVMFRAELDALPIPEVSGAPWTSEIDGKGHLCGHDGHMTFLLGLGRILSRAPVAHGRVVLMFQPAEEDGSGARAVVADPAFATIKPDWAFAIHNEPGKAFGTVSTRAGLINCASQGLRITLSGKTAHAAEPEAGRSPARAVAEIVPAISDLGTGGALDENFRLVTVTHIRVGEPTFGISPGEAEVFATLRTTRDDAMAGLKDTACELVNSIAKVHHLEVKFEVFDEFAASINHTEAAEVAIAAMSAIGIAHNDEGLPMRASEDFGVFGWGAKAAMLCLGPGENYPALHNPDYDFPDDLIPIGVAIFERITRDLLGRV